MSTKAADILELSVAERIQMVEDIWDSIAAVPEAVPLIEGDILIY
jgi:putative addiction module component (TIGR02574 family)